MRTRQQNTHFLHNTFAKTSLEFTLTRDGYAYAFLVPKILFTGADAAVQGESEISLNVPFQDVLDPSTNESTGAFITLAGTDSDTHRRASAMIAKRRAKGGFRAKTFDPDKFLAENIELLAACTLSWRGVVLSGETLPCTKSSAITLYTRFPWLREQVEAFISERTNYLQD